jgi:hypothetical protein
MRLTGSKRDDSIAERRREARFDCVPAIVHAHLNGRDEYIAARVKEVSRSGLQLQTDVPLAVDSAVTIDLPDRTVSGQVRHCDPQTNFSWAVGVMIQSTSNTPASSSVDDSQAAPARDTSLPYRSQSRY